MYSYADSSFLLSLYIPDDNHEKAWEALHRLQKPLSPLTALHRLELRNGLAQWVHKGKITDLESKKVWADIEADTRIFAGGVVMDWGVAIAEAERLSVVYTPTYLTRSLDVIHVAAALNLGARIFVSFDKKQRALAKAVGLAVHPPTG